LQNNVLNTQLTQKRSECEKLSSQVSNLTIEAEKARKDYKIAYESINDLTKKLNEVNKELEEFKNKAKSLENQLLIIDAEALKSDIAVKMNIINELRETLANVKASSAKEQDKMIDEIKTLRSKVKDLENELNSSHKLLELKEASIKSNNLKIDELTKEITTMKE